MYLERFVMESPDLIAVESSLFVLGNTIYLLMDWLLGLIRWG